MSPNETMSDTRQRIDDALGDLREGMLVDGYALEIRSLDAEVLGIEIAARENACADCLVPKPLMQTMIEAAIPADIAIRRIDLVYPSAAAGH